MSPASSDLGALAPLLILVPARTGGAEDPFLLAPLSGRAVIDHTLEAAERHAGPGVSLVVTTDSEVIARHVDARGGAWRIRRRDSAEEALSYFQALDIARQWAEEQEGQRFPTVLILEPSHPFRPAGLIAEALALLRDSDSLDTVVSVVPEYGNVWLRDARGELERVHTQEGLEFYREVAGLSLLTRDHCMDAGSLMGHEVGFIVVEEQWAVIDLHGPESLTIARRFEDLLVRKD